MGMFWRLVKTLGWIFVGFVGSMVPLVAVNWYSVSQYPVGLPWSGEVTVSSWDQGYVSAHGTWTIENIKQAFPIQITRISCFRSDRYCSVATAEVAFGLLTAASEQHKISEWTNSSMSFVNDDPLCVRYVYTIDRTNGRAIGTRTLKEPFPKECSHFFEEKQLSLTLRDGSKVVQELRGAEVNHAMPFAIGAIALWDAFVIYRIVRVWRRREPTRGLPTQPSY